MALAGLPDWHAPVQVAGRVVHAAYERPGHFLVPPLRWEAAGTGDDPAFRVDAYLQDRGEDGVSEFGLLTVRYAAVHDTAALRVSAGAALPGARFEELLPAEGFTQLTSPADVPLPAAVAAPQDLPGAGTSSTACLIRLDGLATDLLVGALRRGLATVRGLVWFAVRGVGARCTGTLTADLAAFTAAAPAVGGRAGTGDPEGGLTPVDDLRRRIREDPAALGLRTTASLDGDNRAAFAEAALDRLLARLARLVPAPRLQPGTWVRIDPAAGQASWNLDDPMVVPRFFALEADPLGPLRSMTVAELESTVLREHVVPALSSGTRRITFSPTVVLPQFGMAEQVVEVTLAANPPARPQALRQAVRLQPGEPTASTTLRTAPSEPLRFEWSVTSVLSSEADVRVVVGPTRTAESAWTTVRPDDTGLRHLPVEVSRALLAEATVHLRATCPVEGRPWVVTGSLDAARPAALLTLPPGAGETEISARATTADGRSSTAAPVTATRLRLDPFAFPGTGQREVLLRLEVPDGPPLPGAGAGVTVEVVPEDATDDARRRGTVRLTAQQPTATWHWYALSPFRTRIRWRAAGSGTWSDPTEGPVVVPAPPPGPPGPQAPPEAPRPADRTTVPEGG